LIIINVIHSERGRGDQKQSPHPSPNNKFTNLIGGGLAQPQIDCHVLSNQKVHLGGLTNGLKWVPHAHGLAIATHVPTTLPGAHCQNKFGSVCENKAIFWWFAGILQSGTVQNGGSTGGPQFGQSICAYADTAKSAKAISTPDWGNFQ